MKAAVIFLCDCGELWRVAIGVGRINLSVVSRVGSDFFRVGSL